MSKKKYRSMDAFKKQYIAHRGLFDNETDAPENSLPAFQKAVENGYGIELDVQLTTDGKLVVFHDKTLKRMCGVGKTLTKCTYEELQKYSLAKSQESIPTFAQALEVIAGKVPLIVEIKQEGDWKKTTCMTAGMLDHYRGIYCMESFHPLAVRWFRKNRPEVLRGQLSSNFFAEKNRKWYEKLFLSPLLTNLITRPDFVAYNHKWKASRAYRFYRRFLQVENVAWTIRSQEELEDAWKDFDVFIFDSFIPH